METDVQMTNSTAKWPSFVNLLQSHTLDQGSCFGVWTLIPSVCLVCIAKLEFPLHVADMVADAATSKGVHHLATHSL